MPCVVMLQTPSSVFADDFVQPYLPAGVAIQFDDAYKRMIQSWFC